VAAERLAHGELEAADGALVHPRPVPAAAGSLSIRACSRVWLVLCPPSAWNDGKRLLHVLHSNTPSASMALRAAADDGVPPPIDDDSVSSASACARRPSISLLSSASCLVSVMTIDRSTDVYRFDSPPLYYLYI